jgi:hypothetical protein
MAAKLNVAMPPQVRDAPHPEHLCAVTEFLNAINTASANVVRFQLEDCDVFLFVVKAGTEHSGQSISRSLGAPQSNASAAGSLNTPSASLEEIIEATGKRLRGSRRALVIGGRSEIY